MGKRKPHPAGRPPKKPAPTEEDEEKGTIFFYMPNEKPYGIFCQWHPSPFNIPIASLQWLVDLAPPPPLSTTSSTTTTTTSASSILSTHATTSPSNPTPFLSFTCAEQSYMYCKSLFFSDSATCTLILSAPDPKTQKKHGQRITNFSFTAWSLVKSRVARVGNWYKFTGGNENGGKGAGNGGRHMRNMLMGTGERELAEAGRRDRVWGIGYRAFEAEGYREWWGENLLGKCLGDVRGRIGEMDGRVREEGEVVDWDWDGGLDGDDHRTDGAEGEGEEGEEGEADASTVIQEVG